MILILSILSGRYHCPGLELTLQGELTSIVFCFGLILLSYLIDVETTSQRGGLSGQNRKKSPEIGLVLNSGLQHSVISSLSVPTYQKVLLELMAVSSPALLASLGSDVLRN